jgi:hypothetical protein
MLICINDDVTSIKPGHQPTGNVHLIQSDESSSMLFPTSGKVYIWRTPKEAYQETFCDGLGSNIMVQYSVGPVITLHGPNSCKGVFG